MCRPEIRFDIINPVTNSKKPHYDTNKDLFLFPVDTKYRYYIEVRNIDENTGEYRYYLLLGRIKFSEHCRLCEVNMYGMCKIHPRGEFKEYVVQECVERGNVDMNKVDANSDYDIWLIG